MPPGLTTTAAGPAEVFTIAGVPYWVVYLAAFGIVLVRAQATYWAGRGLARGTVRTRVAERLAAPRAAAWVARVHRWGPPAVTLSFLTVGIQTVVNLAAGYLRMPFGRYVAALVVGCAAWAAVWTTVGVAAVHGAVVLAARSPVALALLAAGGVALVVGLVRRTARSRRAGLPDA